MKILVKRVLKPPKKSLVVRVYSNMLTLKILNIMKNLRTFLIQTRVSIDAAMSIIVYFVFIFSRLEGYCYTCIHRLEHRIKSGNVLRVKIVVLEKRTECAEIVSIHVHSQILDF